MSLNTIVLAHMISSSFSLFLVILISLSRIEKLTAYYQYLVPKVSFTTPCIIATCKEFEETQRGVIGIMANVLGLNRTFPRIILHAGAEYFGLKVYELAVAQGKNENRYTGSSYLPQRSNWNIDEDCNILY